jgi:REP element-mobilizing transposase RayT
MAEHSHEPEPSLPHRAPLRTHERIVIAHHLILHGYGHWLPNDPRGSGSVELREEKFADLGPIHTGRKPVQPPRSELKRFWSAARGRLEHPILWFDDAKRQAIGEAFAEVVRRERYTVWACAVVSNHAHLCVRRHRDDGHMMWQKLADEARQRLRAFAGVCDGHPVWSERPYVVFLYAPDEVRGRVHYIETNPAKEGLPQQHWPFVKPYDGWPHSKRDARHRS